MGRKSTVSSLPLKIQRHIERRLKEGNLTLDQLIGDLQASFPAEAKAGDLPSRSAVHRYGQKLNQRLDAVKASSEAARIISEQYGDAIDDRGAGLITMIQSELFESVMALSEASSGDMSPEERVALLAAAGKNIGTLARAGVHHREFQAKTRAQARRELIEEQRAKLDELGKTGDVAPEVLARVIKAAYDL